ncbi:UvrD-helicase domain-containing protein [Luteolibacter algae]|uniref:UvrD-helicase domain-containing protein n=1 Tax=Luteolibacter algae TaxID=454151 RepID=A0ABW5D810_9BACT
MTSRASKPDTAADLKLRECLDTASSFVIVAGAGSGKTTSLVKALAHLAKKHGAGLRKRRQQVACITYTEVARDEIWHDVGEDPLFHVSTIHSFLWVLIRSFQKDIKLWVADRIAAKIAESQEKIDKPRTHAATKIKEQRNIVRYQRHLEALDSVAQFIYGTGSNYKKGILGHDDVIKMVPELLRAKPLLRALVAQGFPFVFVDESQDTLQEVVEVLKLVREEHRTRFCLGFFGDPMQKIYTTGLGAIPVDEGWVQIDKPENFRCPPNVLNVINKIRLEGDPLEQITGREHWESDGSAQFFILSNQGDRSARLERVVGWLAEHDPQWRGTAAGDGVKLLVIAHRMAANRLGFPDLYAAFNDNSPPSGLKQGFTDGTSWALTPFLSYLLPLLKAIEIGEGFEAMALLRRNSPAFIGVNAVERPSDLLGALKGSVAKLAPAFADGSAVTVGELLEQVLAGGLISLDGRWTEHLPVEGEAAPTEQAEEGDEDTEDGAEKERQVISAFLGCPARQLLGYERYVNDQSVFATQHGIKGAEFDHVLTILDDEEGSHNQYSYDKFFGLVPLSNKDLENINQGKDSVIERTRRLFYVSCSRATKNLAVVYFTSDVEAAKKVVEKRKYVPSNCIKTFEG